MIGHRDTGVTACPGEQLYYQLSDLRERVGERRPTGTRTDDGAVLPEVVTYSPDGYTFTGASLTDATGCRSPARRSSCSGCAARAGGSSRRRSTDADGDFAATTTFKRNTILRWEFAGDDTYRPFRGDGAAVCGRAAAHAQRLDDERRARRADRPVGDDRAAEVRRA